MARDLAADVVRLLGSGATLEHRTPDGEPAGEEPICPRHIAVLVRTHANAELIRAQLEAARIPAVINGGGNVFGTATARAWLRLLEALERPASTIRARTAAATPFLGWSGEQIATAAEPEWEEVHRRLHHWSRILRDSGVAALAEAIMVSEDLAARMLAETAGERRLTDLNHIAQLLHRAASSERLGVTALRAWLAERTADAGREDPEDERTRRLESDAEAVQVLTIHRSKGLEFPVVYCPFLWEPSYIPRDPEPVFFHDPGAGFRRTVDVGLDGRAWDAHVRRHRDEQRGEDLRLAYVALTRAKHQAVIWWAPSYDSRHSPLGRLLFAKGPNGNVAAEGRSTPADEAADARFADLAEQAHGRHQRRAIGTRRAGDVEPAGRAVRRPGGGPVRSRLSTCGGAGRPTATSPPTRTTRWWRASPSSRSWTTSRPRRPRWRSSQPGWSASRRSGGCRSGSTSGRSSTECSRRRTSPPPTSTRSSPGRYGSAVAWSARAGRAGRARRRPAGRDRDAARPAPGREAFTRHRRVATGSTSSNSSCLSPEATRRPDSSRSEPLPGRSKHLPSGDPMAAYAGRLEDPALRSQVRGFLTGSIDLVVRIDGARFAIVDYKTNWLGPADQPLTLAAYRPEALVAEMSRAHYSLQALLYTVALHRYLRWRLPEYDPDRHLAGVVYLFVRGMAGDSERGVFGWRPPGRLVVALSDVLGRGTG